MTRDMGKKVETKIQMKLQQHNCDRGNINTDNYSVGPIEAF